MRGVTPTDANADRKIRKIKVGAQIIARRWYSMRNEQNRPPLKKALAGTNSTNQYNYI